MSTSLNNFNKIYQLDNTHKYKNTYLPEGSWKSWMIENVSAAEVTI